MSSIAAGLIFASLRLLRRRPVVGPNAFEVPMPLSNMMSLLPVFRSNTFCSRTRLSVRRKLLASALASSPLVGRLVTRHELTHGRDVRQFVGARRGGHREGAQLACPDVRDGRGHGGERYLHLPAQQIGKRGRYPAIRHKEHVGSCHHL